MIENLKKINFKNIVDYIMVILLFFLSIKKGGFYISDGVTFNISILSISFIYFICCVLKRGSTNILSNLNVIKLKNIFDLDNIKNNIKKIDYINILFFALSISYILPIIFKTYTNLYESSFEFLRIFNMFLIYNIVKRSNNKKIYIKGFLVIILIQCLIGIDELGKMYLEPILNIFNSGYLDINLTRLSGTIQYANNLGIFIAMAFVIVLDNFFKNQKNYIYVILAIFLSSVLLTGSRMVFLILIIALIIYIFKRKNTYNLNEMALVTTLLFLTSLIYVTILSNYILLKSNLVYIIFILFVLFNYLCINIYIKVKNNIKKCNKENEKKYDKKRGNNNINNKIFGKILILIFVVIIAYISVGMYISKPLYINSNQKDTKVYRNIYGIKKGEDNKFKIDIKDKEPDSRYELIIYEIQGNYEGRVLNIYEYYNTSNGKFEFDFKASEDSKYLNIYINCYKGSVLVDNAKLNEKNNILEYKILPSQLINRLKDSLYGSTTVRDRIEYTKDSFKIITKSPSTFIFGTGGEGFKNLYKEVQTLKYTSTEVHNTYLQIFVESGIIGFLCIIGIVILSLKNSKNNIVKLVYIMFLIYAIFDISFSYMLSQAIFSIIIGILEKGNKQERIKMEIR